MGWAIREPVCFIRHEAGHLNLTIHCVLQQMIDPGGLALNVSAVSQLGLDRDGKLMTGVAGEAESFGIVADEFDCHIGWFPFVVFDDVRTQKSPTH